jgi:hypothetical protein
LKVDFAGFEIGPSKRFIAGAMIDLIEDLMSASTQPQTVTPSEQDENFPNMQLSVFKGRTQDKISLAIAQAIYNFESRIPSLVENVRRAVNNKLLDLRANHLVAHCLLPKVASYPQSPLLVESLQAGLHCIKLEHVNALPTFEPVELTIPRVRATLPGIAALTISVLCLLYLYINRWYKILLVLLSIVAATASLRPIYCLRRACHWLTLNNAQGWSCSTGFGSHRFFNTVNMGHRIGLGVGLPSPGCLLPPAGIIAELEPDQVAVLGTLLQQYLLHEFLFQAPLGCAIALVSFGLRFLVKFLMPDLPLLPVVIPFDVPTFSVNESAVPNWPFPGKAVVIPKCRLAVLLDINLKAVNSHLSRLRLVIPDQSLQLLADSLQCQLSSLDLRLCDDRFAGFLQELQCHFDFSISWPQPGHVLLRASDIQMALHLPP